MLLMVFAVFFYSLFYPMPYRQEVLKEVPIALVDFDRSAVSRQLGRMIDATEEVSVACRPRDLDEAQRLFMDRKVYGLVVIPEGFERKVYRQEQATVSVYADGGYFLMNRQVRGGVSRAVGTLSAGVEIKRLEASGLNHQAAMDSRAPLQLVATALGNPAGGYGAYVVPAVFVLVLQQTLLAGISMLAGAPVKSGHIATTSVLTTVLGKAAAYLPIYLGHAAYYLVICPRVYGFRQQGDAVSLLILVIPFLLSVIFLGMAIANLSPDREVPMMVVVFSSLPLLFLSGFSWPPEAFPSWVRALSWFVPTTAGIDGLLRINQMGAGWRHVAGDWLVLGGLACLYFPVACWSEARLRRRHTGNHAGSENFATSHCGLP
jgi:ABC-2 type transport system permease protein